MPRLKKEHLINWFKEGEKKREDWKIGTEHEKFVFHLNNLERVGYFGKSGISELLNNLAKENNWEKVLENNNIIGLKDETGASISLEPGGQLELSGSPLENLHQTCKETGKHLQIMKKAINKLGLSMIGLGYDPKWSRKKQKWMPKGRYEIMKKFMPKVGELGLDMMLRTCTIQVNLDYSSETDMAKKLRVAACIQPLVTALFASSPIFEGNNTGHQSWRAQIWKNTDNDRTGIPKFIFDDDLSFDSWIEYALDVPMYFIKRDGDYVNLSGESFRMFMEGQLKSLPNHRATYSDWIDHLTTIFTDVRLKNFIEMRGADGGPSQNVTALAAMWVGLLYDSDSLGNIFNLVRTLDWQSVNELSVDVCKYGMNATINDKTLWEFGEEVLNIAQSGLQNRGMAYGIKDESLFLMPLLEQVSKKQSLSSQLANKFDRKWKNNFSTFYDDFSFYHGLRN